MRYTFLLLWVVGLTACNLGEKNPGTGPGDPPAGSAGSYDRATLLRNVAHDVIVPIYANAAEAAAALSVAATAHAEAVDTSGVATGPTLASAQTAWRAAMVAWQRAEAMQIGPAAPVGQDAGAEGLRDAIYSWPSVNTCRVDQELVAKGYEQASFFADKLVNVYGFDALEYLLFVDSPDNTCAPQSDINSGGGWAALDDAELAKRRANYAAAVAGDLKTRTAALASRWAPNGEDFAAALASPGVNGSPYADEDEALNAIFHGLFHLELIVKDDKIAYPAGIAAACGAPACPEDVESPWSDHSKENVLANLEAFGKAFFGGDAAGGAYGFDDALRDVGAAALADAMTADLAATVTAVEAVPGTFRDALVADDAALDAIYVAFKKVTDELKSDFVTALTLQVPSEGAGDTD